MRTVFRWLRRGLTALFVIGTLAGAIYFAYVAISGIVDEVEFRREQNRRDEFREQTATFIAPSIAAESQLLMMEKGEITSTVEIGQSGDETAADATPLADTAAPTNVEAPPAETPTPETEATEVGIVPLAEPAAEDRNTLPENTNADSNTVASFAIVPATPTPVTPTVTLLPPETQPPTSTRTPSLTATVQPTLVAQEPPTAFPTNTQPPTGLPTNTPFPTNTDTPTATLTSTDTPTPTHTATPTWTFTPSNTPTYTPTPRPTLVIEGTYITPIYTPITDLPLRAPLVETDPDIVNIALLGSDVQSSLARTDVIIILSINKQASTVAMWHIPRDLLVYVPDNTMNKINLTFQIGQQNGWGGGALFKEMFEYNFGVKIDYYARVDFGGYRAIIETLGGLTVSVDCPLTDWRLIDGFNAPQEAYSEEGWEPYWEQYTLPVGVHSLDPYMALWYARSRQTTNDIDRGRRQMDILRAMWRQARQTGIFDQVLSLWPQALQIVDTDMQLDDVLALLPIAVSLDLGNIERYSMRQEVHMTSWTTPDDGRYVFLGNWPAIRALAQDFVTPPNQNRLQRDAARVEVQDGTLYGLGWGQVAVERLAWEGFSPVTTENNRTLYEVSQIYDFTGQEKGSDRDRLQTILRISDANVISQPDPNRQYDYRVIIGRSYNSCVYGSSADEVVLPAVPGEITDPNK